ncbi:hypothetical protein ACFFJ7_05385 [Pseudochelatococcus lubricantis]|uniref:hypothetical protein n=1 Tax=Pseudochelatococcus lubricantis TaxID=1538102 RepID=UPI0035E85A3F
MTEVALTHIETLPLDGGTVRGLATVDILAGDITITTRGWRVVADRHAEDGFRVELPFTRTVRGDVTLLLTLPDAVLEAVRDVIREAWEARNETI